MSQSAAAAPSVPRHRLAFVALAGLTAATAVIVGVRVVTQTSDAAAPALHTAGATRATARALAGGHRPHLARWKAPAVPHVHVTPPPTTLPPNVVTVPAASPTQPAGTTDTAGGQSGTGGDDTSSGSGGDRSDDGGGSGGHDD